MPYVALYVVYVLDVPMRLCDCLDMPYVALYVVYVLDVPMS